MICIKNVSKSFGEIKAVDDVSLSVGIGVCAILGINGAGKTTLIRLITGFLQTDAGGVAICDFDIATQRQKALSNIGYVPENNPMYEELTSYEYIKLFADIWKIKESDFIDSLKSLAKKLDITSVMNQKVSTLSKGYKRRVSIIASLIHKPKVIILDEPTDGLDPNQKVAIRNFLKAYSKENIVFISTHIMEDVEVLADRVLLMNKGKIIKDCDIKSFKENNSLIDAFYSITNQEEA